MRASREKPSPCCLPTETTLLDTLAPRVVERGPTGASVLATSTYTIAFPPKANPISSAAAPERPSCIPPPNGSRSFTRTTTDAPSRVTTSLFPAETPRYEGRVADAIEKNPTLAGARM